MKGDFTYIKYVRLNESTLNWEDISRPLILVVENNVVSICNGIEN